MRLRRLLPVISLALIGCAEAPSKSSGFFGSDVGGKPNSSVRRGLSGPSSAGVSPGSLERGTDEFINRDALSSNTASEAIVVPTDNDLVEVSLINASIAAAAKAILGDALKRQYTVSPEARGSITIQSTGPIPKSALLELFQASLSANNARIEKEGNTLKVVPGTSGNRSFRLASQGAGQGASVVVAPLEYVSASQMINLLEPLIEDGLRAVADKKRNLLLLSGPRDQVSAAIDALNLFDVDVLAGKSVALVQLAAADPEAIVDELNVIFETEEGGSLEGVVEFIPNNRLGSVLIISSRAKYLPRAQKWIRQLDKTASGAQRYIQTYDLDNRSAEEIAPVINALLSDAADDVAEESEGGAEAGTAKVAPDAGRNALVVRATRSEHREIQRLVHELDGAPQQVMLEATIAEVTINDQMGLGVRWFLRDGDFNFRFSDVATGAAGSTFPGFSAVFGSGGADAALNALANVTDVKIISSPTLMVLDNQEAVLQIGDQVPVATQTVVDTTTPNAPVVTTVEYRDTGVILNVTPNINRNGKVVLDVVQEVSDVSATNTSGIDSPTIRQRRIATNVLLQDGTTLALGGLVQENDNQTDTKVPGLGDVPILGAAFRNRQSTKRRSELLILIRPYVINSTEDATTVTEYWRTKLSGANTVLGAGLGSPRHQIGDVLR